MKNFLLFKFVLVSIFIQFSLNVTYAQVTQQWVARFNGPVNANDGANSIVVDASGNVYVTGSGNFNVTNSDDWATIKYNSFGVLQWLATYNGPGNGSDAPYTIAVDALGNVYVAGQSTGIGTGRDLTTIKYNSSGIQQWVARYNGLSNTHDGASSIAVDASGNVYVTGYSTETGIAGTGYDYATIKYNPSGVQQWVAGYNGPGDNSDIANSILVDLSGNVYITGYSYGDATGPDFATIKYNTSGVQQWVSRYNGLGNSDDEAHSLAIDGSGNVYVTGQSTGSGTGLDCATLKYNASGVQQWVQRYNGPGNNTDIGWAIAVDVFGNVLITGESTGNGTGQDYATIKYNNDGVQQWVQRYNGPGNGNDIAGGEYTHVLAVDGSGNVFVTGQSLGNGTNTDYATIKYNTGGVLQWVARYNGPGNYFDNANSIAIDNFGNGYVTGQSAGNGTGFDIATIKYSQYYTISGSVMYQDNSQPITSGYVKALKYDSVSHTIITIDSAQIQADGRYTLPHIPQDSTDIMAYQNDEADFSFVPTYYLSTTDWHQAKKIFPTRDLDSINIFAFRLEDHLNPYSVSGSVFDKNSNAIKDAIIYAKIGNSFRSYSISNSAGSYCINNLPPGDYELVENRMGYANDVNLVTITSNNLSSVNFYTTNAPFVLPTPENYILYQNYPNPFNPQTTIEFDLPNIPDEPNGLHLVTIKLFDILGREVETLIDKKLYPGKYEITWDGKNYASGIYFSKIIVISPANSFLRQTHFEETKKLLLIK